MKLRSVVQLNENKIVDRRLLKMIEKIFQKHIRGAKLTQVEEISNGRFRKNIEGEGTVPGNLNLSGSKARAVADKIEKALEKVGFDEFIGSGETVMGVDVAVGGGTFDFIIEIDQD